MGRRATKRQRRSAALAIACTCALTAGCGGDDGGEDQASPASPTAATVDLSGVEGCMAKEGFPLAKQTNEYTALDYLDAAAAEALRENAAGVYVTKPVEFDYDADTPFIDRHSRGAALVLVFDDLAEAQSAASQMPKVALSGQSGNVAWALLGTSDVAVEPTEDTRALAAAVRECGESA